jgi:hypothetical protein
MNAAQLLRAKHTSAPFLKRLERIERFSQFLVRGRHVSFFRACHYKIIASCRYKYIMLFNYKSIMLCKHAFIMLCKYKFSCLKQIDVIFYNTLHCGDGRRCRATSRVNPHFLPLPSLSAAITAVLRYRKTKAAVPLAGRFFFRFADFSFFSIFPTQTRAFPKTGVIPAVLPVKGLR